MRRLISASLRHRPGRTAASVVGIAIGVVLILVIVGLAQGMLGSTGAREGRVGAELLFQAPGGFGPSASAAPLALPVAYADAIADIDGVRATTPVARYIRSGAGGLGFELIEGIAFDAGDGWASYPDITGISIAEGHWPTDGEIIIDRERARNGETTVGSTVELLGRSFRVAGIYEPEIGARIKMPIETLQQMLGGARKCSWVLVETDTPEIQEAVATRIDRKLPGNQVIFTRDIPNLYAKGLPSIGVFLDVVVGLALVISCLITLLAMYTAVMERTREIGILKSLGMSRRRIVTVVELEALALGALGLVTGLIISIAISDAIVRNTSLVIELGPSWIAGAAAVALLGGALGALYPAVRAANRDPVEALAHE